MITQFALQMLALIYTSSGFQVPRPISSLLAAVESNEIQRDRSLVGSQEYWSNLNLFNAMTSRVHASFSRKKELPKCLGSNNSTDFLSYDTKCGFSVTPSEYCCQVYAEQACADPAKDMLTARTIVSDRVAGLEGIADPFLYENCMLNKCGKSCSALNTDAECRSCSNVCQRFCLSNLMHICLKRTCGQNLVSLAESAISHKARGFGNKLHEQTEQEVSKRTHAATADLRKVEKAEVMKYVVNLLESKSPVPMCTDAQLINADAAAQVVVDPSGMTFMAALLICNTHYLNSAKLDALISDPVLLGRSEECNVVASCERNHVQLALDRAETQIAVIKRKRQALQEQWFL